MPYCTTSLKLSPNPARRAFVVVQFFEKFAVIANVMNSTLQLPDGTVPRLHLCITVAVTPPL